jgi:hypothetical protein
LLADKATFQSGANESALSISRGALSLDALSARTISKFGDAGNLTADIVSVYDFALAAGRTGFTGPADWEVKESVVLENISLSVERLEIGSFINAARGQEVFIDDTELSYSVKSGIEAGVVSASNITVRDQISSALASGASGAVLLDVRPAGTSVLPDVLVAGIDNGAFEIISSPEDGAGKKTDCKNVISSLSGRAMVSVNYNQMSLMQNIVCQYVFWQRLERRIDIKKCLLEGGVNCG